MARRLRSAALLTAAMLCVPRADAAEVSDFSGEILLAAPPPGWSVRDERRDGGIISKAYEPPIQAGAGGRETLTFETALGEAKKSLDEVEQAIYAKYRKRCGEVKTQPAEPVPGGGHESIIVSLLCLDPRAMDAAPPKAAEAGAATAGTRKAAFVMVKVMQGEFNGYRIERVWLGPRGSATMPANSSRQQSSWMNYFASVRICNTLAENCDLRSLPSPDSNPRFRVMHQIAVSVKPVVNIALVLNGAETVGRLTGQAEQCGEDVSSFVAKIDRMFEFVTATPEDAKQALEIFRKALRGGRNTSMGNAPPCGDTLSDFRAHPTRPGRFSHYLDRLVRKAGAN